MRFSAMGLAAVCLSLCASARAQSPTAVKHQCTIDRTPPSTADLLLNQEKYQDAADAYQAILAKTPQDADARLGLVEVLIGQDRLQAAQDAADAFAHEQPQNGLAQVAKSDSAYRAAQVANAFEDAKQAMTQAPCEGRAAAAMAQLFDLTGLHGRAARLYAQAHALRPLDQSITAAWIGTLPRKERLAALSSFLKSKPALSDDASRSLTNEEQLLTAAQSGGCRVSSSSDRTEATLSPVFGDHNRPIAYGLDVFLDGKRRRMQIDTGASGIVLSESAARGLGLQQEYHVKTGGVGDDGDRDSYLAHVHSMRIGEVELQNCVVVVVNKSGLDVDGLIGMDVFRKYLVTLDYPAAKLRLAPLPHYPAVTAAPAGPNSPADLVNDEDSGRPRDSFVALGMENWMHIARIGHNLLLPAALKPGSVARYMILDTGASRSMFSLPFAEMAGKLHSSPMRFSGISGETRKVFETDDTELYVGTLHLTAASYYAADMTRLSHGVGFELSGLLGLPTLQRLTIAIDYRDDLMKLTYDPKNDRRRF